MMKHVKPMDSLREAIAYFNAGKLEQAEQLCRQITSVNPHHRDAHHLAALVDMRRGNLARAAELLEAHSSEFPDFAPVLNDLGMVQTKLGRLQQAELSLVKAINLAPHMPGYHLNLALVYRDSNMLGRAERHARTAIRQKPDYIQAYRVLSEILGLDGRTAEAVQMARHAYELAPSDPRGLLRLAESLDLADEPEKARATYQQLLASAPGNPQLQMAYGRFLRERGYLREAEELIRGVLAVFPDAPAVHMALSRTVKFDHFDAEMTNMEELLSRSNVSDADRAGLHFALVKAYEDIGDFPKAFGHAVKGNALLRGSKNYDKEDNRAEFERIRSAYTRELVERIGDGGCQDDTPIFVVGMPRSGTSLTEQILASHPQVYGAGELQTFGALIRDMTERLAAENELELTQAASVQDWRALGEDYITQLRRRSGSARRIVDKLPANFRYLGAIRLALPKAKVVFCQRTAPDNCVSIFNLELAANAAPYGYDLGELGDYYRQHLKLLSHWQEAMPGFMFVNQYEQLVSDQEGQTRRLLDFCDLGWDDHVLQFHTSQRRVHTASDWQVQQPIYQTSVGRYRRYGQAIKPLLEALGMEADNTDF